MVDHDRGRVALALGDDGPDLVLWYPLGALRRLLEEIKADCALVDSPRLVTELLTPRTVAAYVWAGRLWENRQAEREKIAARVEWSPRPSLEITSEVRRALLYSLTGKDPKDEAEADEAPENPPESEPKNGAGHAPSVSHSANSG